VSDRARLSYVRLPRRRPTATPPPASAAASSPWPAAQANTRARRKQTRGRSVASPDRCKLRIGWKTQAAAAACQWMTLPWGRQWSLSLDVDLAKVAFRLGACRTRSGGEEAGARRPHEAAAAVSIDRRPRRGSLLVRHGGFARRCGPAAWPVGPYLDLDKGSSSAWRGSSNVWRRRMQRACTVGCGSRGRGLPARHRTPC